jgi:hypothetical protein
MVTATCAAIRILTVREGVGYKLYTDNFFSSPDIMMTCTQEVSTVVGIADKIIGNVEGALIRSH